MRVHTRGRIMAISISIFLAIMFVIPFLYPYGSFIGLDGHVGVLDSTDKVAFADPISRIMYGIGDAICHQEQARSLILNGSQTVFCHRDMGILMGVATGFYIFFDRRFLKYLSKRENVFVGYKGENKVISRIVDKQILLLGVLLTTITLVEWLIEFTTFMDLPVARVVTGIISGVGVAMIMQWAVTR